MKKPSATDIANQNAEVAALSLALVRMEIDNLQLDLVEHIESVVTRMTEPTFRALVEQLVRLEADKNSITKLIEEQAAISQSTPPPQPNTIVQNFDVKIPDDVIRAERLDSVIESVDARLSELVSSVGRLKDADVPRQIAESSDLVSALFEERVKTLDAVTQKQLTDILAKIANSHSKLESMIADVQKNHTQNLTDFAKEYTKVLTQLESDFGRRVADIERDAAKNVKEVQIDHERDTSRVESLVDANNVDIKKLTTLVDKHSATLSKIKDAIKTVVDSQLTRTDIKNEVKSLINSEYPIPKDGRDGKDGESGKNGRKGERGEAGEPAKNWIFQFDKNERGILMYRREDEKSWKREDLLGPKGERGLSGGSSGGGGSLGVDVFNNGKLIAKEAQQINFIGSNVTFSRPNPITVDIAIASSGGGGGGSPPYYVNGVLQTGVKTVLVEVATTDDTGTFAVNLSTYAFNNIFDVTVWSPMLSDVSLNPIERKVDVAVETYAPSGITGYAFVNRQIVRLVGGGGYALQSAPVGTTIHITITGN